MSKRGLFAVASALAFALLGPTTAARADEPPSVSLTVPPLALSVTPTAGGGPWKMKIENTGDVPVRLAADPRLLVLEVTPPEGFVDDAAVKAKRKPDLKPVRCALPDDARPATDEGRELVVPSRRSWSVTIDPLLYCFSAHDRARLVVGATVKPRFGWPLPTAKAGAPPSKKPVMATPPFVAAPVGAAVGKIAPAKELQGAAFTLSESGSGTGTGSGTGSRAGTLSVTMSDSLDVGRGVEVSANVTVANDGDKAVVMLLRPETLRFTVSGPAGSFSCGTTREIGSPIRELYSTLGVKGRATISLLLTAVCPSDTFDEPGIYRVTPILDTSGASGRTIGLKTWDGVVEGRAPMLMRVRSPRRPRAPVNRPALD